MNLDFEDRRLLRWLTIYGASVATQAEESRVDYPRTSENAGVWRVIFDRARHVANMDKEHGAAHCNESY